MAGINTTAQALARLTVRRTCSWADIYTGQRDDLVAAGIVRNDQFPGRPGVPNKLQTTYYNGVLRSRYTKVPAWDSGLLIINLKGKGRAEVWVGVDAEEKKRRSDKVKDDCAQDRDRKEAGRVAGLMLERMPSRHETYRAGALTYFDAIRGSLGVRATNDHGFSYDREVIAEVDQLLDEVRELLRTGLTTFSRKRHEAAIQKHRSAIARADDRFLSVIDALQIAPNGAVVAEEKNV